MRFANRADDFDWTPPGDVAAAIDVAETHRGRILFCERRMRCDVELFIIPCSIHGESTGSVNSYGQRENDKEPPPTKNELIVATVVCCMNRLKTIYSEIEKPPMFTNGKRTPCCGH